MAKIETFLSLIGLFTTLCSPYVSTELVFDEDGDTFAPSAQRALKEGRAPARLVTQFATIIDCATGRSPILDYGNYGCYCGLGGKGEPLDATDECCMFHDRCYKQIVADRLCASDWSVRARWYSYRSDNCGTPQVTFTCKNPVNYKLFERVLSGANPQCAHAVCECDKAAAMCLKDAEFNPHFRMYSKLLMCGKILNTLPEIIPRISPNAGQPGVNNSLPTTRTSPNAGQPGVNNSLPTTRTSPNAGQPGVNNSLPTTRTSPNAGQPGVNNSLPTMPMRQPPAN